MTSEGKSLAAFRVPPRSEVARRPLLTTRMVLEPIHAGISRKLYRAVEDSRDFLEPWLPWVPFNDSPEASRRYAEACEADWDAHAALRFSLRLRNEPQLIGVVTLESCSALHRSCDLGYWLRPASTGQGFMTEAASTVVDWAFGTLGAHRIRCAAAIDNLPSRRVIERLGFSLEGTARDAERVAGRWATHAVYARLATDDQRAEEK